MQDLPRSSLLPVELWSIFLLVIRLLVFWTGYRNFESMVRTEVTYAVEVFSTPQPQQDKYSFILSPFNCFAALKKKGTYNKHMFYIVISN